MYTHYLYHTFLSEIRKKFFFTLWNKMSIKIAEIDHAECHLSRIFSLMIE